MSEPTGRDLRLGLDAEVKLLGGLEAAAKFWAAEREAEVGQALGILGVPRDAPPLRRRRLARVAAMKASGTRSMRAAASEIAKLSDQSIQRWIEWTQTPKAAK